MVRELRKANMGDHAALNVRQSANECRDERLEVAQAIATGVQYHHGNPALRDVLLKSKITIHGDQRIEVFFGDGQKLSVFRVDQPI